VRISSKIQGLFILKGEKGGGRAREGDGGGGGRKKLGRTHVIGSYRRLSSRRLSPAMPCHAIDIVGSRKGTQMARARARARLMVERSVVHRRPGLSTRTNLPSSVLHSPLPILATAQQEPTPTRSINYSTVCTPLVSKPPDCESQNLGRSSSYSYSSSRTTHTELHSYVYYRLRPTSALMCMYPLHLDTRVRRNLEAKTPARGGWWWWWCCCCGGGFPVVFW
jgi:hypothetical protein